MHRGNFASSTRRLACVVADKAPWWTDWLRLLRISAAV